MNVVLWIVAALLALAFFGAGAAKLATPRSELEGKMGWVAHATDGQVKLVGLLEVLGAIGLILPAVLDIAPVLVPVAAVGLALTMVGAVVVHRRINDPAAAIVPPVVLGALAVFVAVLRFGSESF